MTSDRPYRAARSLDDGARRAAGQRGHAVRPGRRARAGDDRAARPGDPGARPSRADGGRYFFFFFAGRLTSTFALPGLRPVRLAIPRWRPGLENVFLIRARPPLSVFTVVPP